MRRSVWLNGPFPNTAERPLAVPFKVANSPFYKVEITLLGYGKTPRLSTKSTRIWTARKMEEALRFVWEDGYHELIEALEPRGPGPTALIDLPTLYHAWRRGELEELASWAPYPDLKEAVETFAATLDYENYRRGALHLLLEGKGEGERAFSLAYHQIYYRWRKALEAARLTPEAGFEKGVRIKDLRHTFAAHYVQAGGDIAGLMARLRHKRGQQSLQYARYETRGGADMQRAARKMGLRLPADLRRTLPEPGENGRDRPPLEVPVWWFDPEEPPRAREQLQLALTGRRRNE